MSAPYLTTEHEQAMDDFDDGPPPITRPWIHLETSGDVEGWIENYNRDLQRTLGRPDSMSFGPSQGQGICFHLDAGGDIFLHTTADGDVLLDVTEGVCHDLFMVSELLGMEKEAEGMRKNAGLWLTVARRSCW